MTDGTFSNIKIPGESTVFLVQENPYISVLSATDYGTIVTLFESGSQIMFRYRLGSEFIELWTKQSWGHEMYFMIITRYAGWL